MSIKNKLNLALKGILPKDPKSAVKGTELIALIRERLDEPFSEASLRYHFSVMSCDPSSVIAKVDKGQGYYRRATNIPALTGAQEILSMTQGSLEDLDGRNEEVDLVLQRIRKFRAIVLRYHEVNGRFPMAFKHAFDAKAHLSNIWKFPEVALVDWNLPHQEEVDEITKLKEMVQKQLFIPPYSLTSARLRMKATEESIREDFFQAVSAGQWANSVELIYANSIEDEAIVRSLRKLSQDFGVGITTFGIDSEILDDLPSTSNILKASDRETEAILSKVNLSVISLPKRQEHLQWQNVDEKLANSPDIQAMFRWLNRAVENRYIEPFADEES